MVETEESSSSSGITPSHPGIPAHLMESVAGTEHVEGSRGFCLGSGDSTKAKAFKIMMTPRVRGDDGALCCSTGEPVTKISLST